MKLSSCIQIRASAPRACLDKDGFKSNGPASGLFLFFQGNAMSEIKGWMSEPHVLCLGVLLEKVSDRRCGCPGRLRR